ncbi:MAG: hypothetical protein WB721_00965, partial [Pseudolabrys sp.]
ARASNEEAGASTNKEAGAACQKGQGQNQERAAQASNTQLIARSPLSHWRRWPSVSAFGGKPDMAPATQNVR